MIRGILKTVAVMVAAVLAAGGLSACADAAMPGTSPSPSYGPDIVHYGGFREIQFGDPKPDLTGRGALKTEPHGCGPHLAAAPELSPIFDGDRLVLLWVNPPYRTPEGITVGAALADVRQAYPDAQELRPPAGSFVFPGLLATQDDRAYLFLHDERTVQKTIVGYAESVRRLYDHGFGVC